MAGAVVLLAGWVAAAFVFLMASHGDDTAATSSRVVDGQVYTMPLDASKRESRETERMGGKMAVRMMALQSWIGTLWQGRRLACTLALLSTAVGATLLYLAGLAAEEMDA
jgi:hypothetical protein